MIAASTLFTWFVVEGHDGEEPHPRDRGRVGADDHVPRRRGIDLRRARDDLARRGQVRLGHPRTPGVGRGRRRRGLGHRRHRRPRRSVRRRGSLLDADHVLGRRLARRRRRRRVRAGHDLGPPGRSACSSRSPVVCWRWRAPLLSTGTHLRSPTERSTSRRAESDGGLAEHRAPATSASTRSTTTRRSACSASPATSRTASSEAHADRDVPARGGRAAPGRGGAEPRERVRAALRRPRAGDRRRPRRLRGSGRRRRGIDRRFRAEAAGTPASGGTAMPRAMWKGAISLRPRDDPGGRLPGDRGEDAALQPAPRRGHGAHPVQAHVREGRRDRRLRAHRRRATSTRRTATSSSPTTTSTPCRSSPAARSTSSSSSTSTRSTR